MDTFQLEEYLTRGVENIVKGAIKATLKNPKESAFIGKFMLAAKKAALVRKENEERGMHIPPFLIASITSSCNLHCAGCYARSNQSCHDGVGENQMSGEEWNRIFAEAKELGISFILLAGGEPLMRRDVLEQAVKHPQIVFPVFTNGTMLDASYINLLDKNRNVIPVLSIEGEKEETDRRRGEGVYQKLEEAMSKLQDKNLLFGASITVTTENVEKVTSTAYIKKLQEKGCKLVIFVEYVPVNVQTKHLALGEKERTIMEKSIGKMREEEMDMIFLSFPGDEKSSGGCLAAGRGFFHINSKGGAEPCPFSPYSDTNIRGKSLKDALQSPLFFKLQKNACMEQEHIGGCVLFEQEEKVKQLAGGAE